ncbi:hypothetical protein [Candidatus Magnetominusculus xianensis]|uniref:Uncharacterized protein n=1 Tax=Candidatus Magnetominusculus xianensis TaxID=1748249 RepID=A0ABR5SJZ7_9BACT|nr:hypothetical protein [Candidatus Magnetominusculus xianensis]KWT92945.1 hypothetical protein ASN18_0380 [Candidatus Magnetominusculus xianensis]MBF0402949.1 hypothetical protein [Nitrospirota bacterium]
MIKSINALLTFCEGPHDVAYVRMVLRKLLNFKIVKAKFKELPSPFNAIFKKTVQEYVQGDLSLDMAHKFFLPDTILQNGNHMILLFNCGGKDNYDKVRTLISDYLEALQDARTFPQGAEDVVDSTRYLFVYDADAKGIKDICCDVTTNFCSINNGEDFITQDWGKAPHSDFGRVAGDKAVYVWGENPGRGTLEDILIPLFANDNEELMTKATSAVVKMFPRDTDNNDAIIAVPALAKQKKSILTLLGQGEKPGSSIAVILEQSKLLTDTTLKDDERTGAFTKFVAEFINLRSTRVLEVM